MQLFLTSVLPFLAHDHPSAAAFLTCRHHNFHSSIIPEFLSDEDRTRNFCGARQQNRFNRFEADEDKQYKNLYNLFVRTPLMQFSPALVFHYGYSPKSILKRLFKTRYFTRTLQRCCLVSDVVTLANDLLRALSKVQSLTNLDLGWCANEQLEIIINYFPSLETLTIRNASCLDPKTAISITSPPPPATTKTLRRLTMLNVDPTFTTQFVPHFPNLRKLVLHGQHLSQRLDLLPLSSSLPLLTDLSLTYFCLKNSESLKNPVHLSSLEFIMCCIPDLSFLTQENSLPELRTLRVHDSGDGLSSSSAFASLTHAPNLHDLAVNSKKFDNDCLQYLENMVHLRKLDLSSTNIVGDSRSLKILMQNLFQLEELNLMYCNIGSQGAISGTLYNTHSRLRVVNLSRCNLADDDLNGIGALKNTLEKLDLTSNKNLTPEGLMYCKDLVKVKKLKLNENRNIDELLPLKDCLNLEELDVSFCGGLNDYSFRVFGEEPNSFPNLRILNLSSCYKLTEKVFEHLSKNNHLVYQLRELHAGGMSTVFSSNWKDATARNNLYKLKGLRQVRGTFTWLTNREVIQNLKNLDIFEYHY